MKKIFLILLCLFTVFIIAGASFASSDFDNAANNASIEISNSQHGDLSISANMVSKDKTNPNETIGIKGGLNQKNQSSAVSGNGPKLNISGPKINASNLQINGPKINGNGPKIQVTKNQGVVCFKGGTSGMNGARGGEVADTGEDLVDFLDDTGVINKTSYCLGWITVKGAELISDSDFPEPFEEYLINEVAFGDLGRLFKSL